MKQFRTISRILVGIVFVFSGFVKGVDPLGTAYRIEDYFQAFHFPWAVQFALFLSIALCTLEFTLGVSMIFNLWLKRTVYLLIPLMVYFTILTFFDATVNLVPDCGCFGDAVKLTNLQTFLKNIVLLILVIPLFTGRKKIKGVIPVNAQITALLIFALAFGSMSVYAYRHLPLIDFMAWKVGKKVNEKPAKPLQFYLTFKNRKTGKEAEFLSPNYPWNDSIWMKEWEFKTQRVIDPNGTTAPVLRIEDDRGMEVTSTFLDNPDLQFILVSNDLQSSNKEAFIKILPFYKKAMDQGVSFIALTVADPPRLKKFKMDHGIAIDFYNSNDDVVLKTMVRSNPGLILLKNGVVLAKWHYNDFPGFDEVMTRFKQKESTE